MSKKRINKTLVGKRVVSIVLSIILAFALCIVPTKDVRAAATYPLFVPSQFETVGTVGDTISIEFKYIPYYANEITHVEVYNSSGTLMATAEKKYYHTSRELNLYTVTWDTTGKAAGRYTVKSYVEYYSTYYDDWLKSVSSEVTTFLTLNSGSSSYDTDDSSSDDNSNYNNDDYNNDYNNDDYSNNDYNNDNNNNNNSNNSKKKSKYVSGVGTISADGKRIKDDSGITYYVSGKIYTYNLKKNLMVADKKTSGKYKITKITYSNGYITGGTVTYMKPYNKNCKTATVKNTIKIAGKTFKVTAINKKAFKFCDKLSKVNIGANVTKIGTSAFYGCEKLKSINIKTKKLKKVGGNAFKFINNKAKFKLPKKLNKKLVKKYKKMIKKAKAPKKVKITK